MRSSGAMVVVSYVRSSLFDVPLLFLCTVVCVRFKNQ